MFSYILFLCDFFFSFFLYIHYLTIFLNIAPLHVFYNEFINTVYNNSNSFLMTNRSLLGTKLFRFLIMTYLIKYPDFGRIALILIPLYHVLPVLYVSQDPHLYCFSKSHLFIHLFQRGKIFAVYELLRCYVSC